MHGLGRLAHPIRAGQLRRLNRPIYAILLGVGGLFFLTGVAMLLEPERWASFPSTAIFVSHRPLIAETTAWLMIVGAGLTLLVAFKWPRWAWGVLTVDVGLAAAWAISYVYAWGSNSHCQELARAGESCVPLAPAIVWSFVTYVLIILLGLPRNLQSTLGEDNVRDALGPITDDPNLKQ